MSELTKREKFTLAIAQGMASNRMYYSTGHEDFSHEAIAIAEHLIEYLEGTDPDKLTGRS